MKENLDAFKIVSLHTSINDKIISKESYCKALGSSILYTSERVDTIDLQSEYYNLAPDLELQNNTTFFDISFNYSAGSSNTSLVYQLTNSNDSVLLWKNFGLAADASLFQEHIKIKKQEVKDSILYFKTYLWNPEQMGLQFSKLDVIIHSGSSAH